MVVVLDTAAPEIDIAVARLKPSVSGDRFFQCLVHDANPDPSSVKLEYQTQEKTWLPLEPVDLGPDQPGVFRLSEAMEKNSTGLLRASARDRAGNFAMREAQIKLAAPERAASTTARNRSDNLVVRSDKLAIPVEPTPPVAPQLTSPNRDAAEATPALPAPALAASREAPAARPNDRFDAAPVPANFTRCMPMARLMLSSTRKSATRCSALRPGEGFRPSSSASATFSPTPIAH